MATQTTNLGLTQPGYTDAAEVAVLNTNFAILDNVIGVILERLKALEDAQSK